MHRNREFQALVNRNKWDHRFSGCGANELEKEVKEEGVAGG